MNRDGPRWWWLTGTCCTCTFPIRLPSPWHCTRGRGRGSAMKFRILMSEWLIKIGDLTGDVQNIPDSVWNRSRPIPWSTAHNRNNADANWLPWLWSHGRWRIHRTCCSTGRTGRGNHVRSIFVPQTRRRCHLERHGNTGHTYIMNNNLITWGNHWLLTCAGALHEALRVPQFTVWVDYLLVRFESFVATRAIHIPKGHISCRYSAILKPNELVVGIDR